MLAAWRDAQLRRFDQPEPSGETWVDTGSSTASRSTTAAPNQPWSCAPDQYPGGRLDWYSFDVDAKLPPHQVDCQPALHGLSGASSTRWPCRSPTPGMPASRYWQFEEGAVYFGGVEAGPADLGRLLVAEFATVYSDDWFLVPVRFPIGASRGSSSSACATPSASATRALLRRMGREAGRRRPRVGLLRAERRWVGARRQGAWLALVPPLLTLHGAPLETVSFVRDEAANLAWAIEERIETAGRRLAGAAADGGPLAARRRERTERRRREARRRLALSAADAGTALLDSAGCRTPGPGLGSGAAAQGAHARLVGARGSPGAGAKGTLLTPNRPFVLHEEEIPRGGVQVTRRWQVARGADGGRISGWRAESVRGAASAARDWATTRWTGRSTQPSLRLPRFLSGIVGGRRDFAADMPPSAAGRRKRGTVSG